MHVIHLDHWHFFTVSLPCRKCCWGVNGTSRLTFIFREVSPWSAYPHTLRHIHRVIASFYSLSYWCQSAGQLVIVRPLMVTGGQEDEDHEASLSVNILLQPAVLSVLVPLSSPTPHSATVLFCFVFSPHSAFIKLQWYQVSVFYSRVYDTVNNWKTNIFVW